MLHRDILTAINLDDLVSSFGWQARPLLARALRYLFSSCANRFAEQILAFDAAVGRHGELAGPARDLLQRHYVRDLRIDGMGNIPKGPVLFLSNHPGMADSLCLFAAMQRAALKIVAQQRPFLEALPNVAAHLIFIDDNIGRRVLAAHQVAAHLAAGGAAVTFPSGSIEPDPAVDRAALESLRHWADCVRGVLRLAPGTAIVPVLVSGVVSPTASHHWLTRLRPGRHERDKMAAALQLIAMVSRGERPTRARVRFGAPIVNVPPDQVHARVIAQMRRMMLAVIPEEAPAITSATQPTGWVTPLRS